MPRSPWGRSHPAPWEFDTTSGDDERHLWFTLALVAQGAEAEAMQAREDYKKNMQYAKDRR
jgi:hypothetical protein